MKTVHNLTRLPVRVPLPGGKTLHLGPGKTGKISDAAVDAPGVQRLIKDKTIEIVGSDDGGAPDGSGGSGGKGPSESTHGHKPPAVVTPRGNR